MDLMLAPQEKAVGNFLYSQPAFPATINGTLAPPRPTQWEGASLPSEPPWCLSSFIPQGTAAVHKPQLPSWTKVPEDRLWGRLLRTLPWCLCRAGRLESIPAERRQDSRVSTLLAFWALTLNAILSLCTAGALCRALSQ